MLKSIHHTAIICSDYQVSKRFYTEVLGLNVIREVYRAERSSYKLDLSLNGQYVIELFSFPDPPDRLSQPESCGLRHLAFEVTDIVSLKSKLEVLQIAVEPIRIDEYTGKKYTFIQDPDQLPIEFYEE